jgi:hypothetical protein
MPDGAAALLRLSTPTRTRLAEDGHARPPWRRTARIRDAANIAQGVLREQRRLRSLERFRATVRLGADATTGLDAGLADTGRAILSTFMPRADVEPLRAAAFSDHG